MKKLLLFDIDGTLITGLGVPKRVAIETIKSHFPHFKNGYEVPFNGMTDPLIVQKVLSANNHPIEIDDPIIDVILEDFLDNLAQQVNRQQPPGLLPGVLELLKTLQLIKEVELGLVTGNMKRGAQIKLEAVDIYDYFPIGAFGSDHWDRNELPPIAIKRSEAYFETIFKSENIWIIGDSPKDVECAKKNNLKCLAVETGKMAKGVMEASNPEHLIADLSDIEKVLQCLQIR